MNYDDSERVTVRLSHSRLGLRAEPESIALLQARWQVFWQNYRKPVVQTFAEILAKRQQKMSSPNQLVPRPPNNKLTTPGRQLLAKKFIIFRG